MGNDMATLTAGIRPKVKGEADFYSWQLYRWHRKQGPEWCEVWKSDWNPLDGHNPDTGRVMIGRMDDLGWFYGVPLRSLCGRGQKLKRWAYGDTTGWKNITAEFWAEYRRIGVCAIHGDTAHQWLVDGDSRHCEYCGKQMRRIVDMVPRERWITPPTGEGE